MRLLRYQINHGKPLSGWLLDDHVGPLQGTPFGAFQREEADIPLEDVRLLPPILPSKVICVARNYAAHA
ncbi:MAG: DUF2437 domain-containing protein, partial [Anaerolineales bacterium]|nr:DUF2437 domain-containing protein [Anaerolineales bacterium]